MAKINTGELISPAIWLDRVPGETRLALVEQGVLQEVIIERDAQPSLLGNIYLAQVQRLMPQLKIAFLDIGSDKAATLSLDDRPDAASLRPGQKVWVQIIRAEYGNKGVKASLKLRLSGAYISYTPMQNERQISLAIQDELERQRLLALLPEGAGFRIHRSAQGIAEDILLQEWHALQKRWQALQVATGQLPGLRYRLSPLIRVLQTEQQIAKVYCQEQDLYKQSYDLLAEHMPYHLNKLSLTQQDLSYRIDQQLDVLWSTTIPFANIGHLILEQTQALVAIDVNSSHSGSAFEVNHAACTEIARQLRLRNLSGLIIIDFIKMASNKEQQSLLAKLGSVLAVDPCRPKISSISSLGLVQITRRRLYPSLSETLAKPCDHCGGHGQVKSAETVVFEILRQIQRRLKEHPVARISVKAAPDVIALLQNHDVFKLALACQAETLYHPEQYSISWQ